MLRSVAVTVSAPVPAFELGLAEQIVEIHAGRATRIRDRRPDAVDISGKCYDAAHGVWLNAPCYGEHSASSVPV